MLRLRFILVSILCLTVQCTKVDKPEIEIIAISSIPDPKTVPYPNGAAICLCRDSAGERILVAVKAFENRQVLASFTDLKPGSKIPAELIPWKDRPEESRAMFLANEFADEFDLKVFFIGPG